MRITCLTIASSLIALCSCGSGGPSNSGVVTGPPQPRTVAGTQIVTYVSETGTTDIPDDLSKTTIAAYAPNGSGGYTMLPGSGTSDGHYTIPNVPSGGYLLQIGSSYFSTTATNVDTGSQVQGRANPTLSATGERIDFDISLSVPANQVPQVVSDVFELVVPNQAAESFDYLATPYSSNTFNQVFFWPNALIDASLGDKSYFLHLQDTSSVLNPGPNQTMYRTRIQLEMTPALSIQMVPGVTTGVSGSMVQGAPVTFRANFKLSAFAALSSQMVAGDSLGGMFAGVAAAPPFAVAGGFPGPLYYTDYPVDTLASFYLYPSSASDVDLGDIVSRNSFPADYQTLVFADWGLAGEFSPSGAFPASVNADIRMNSLTPPSVTHPLSPQLGPVTSLRLDGADVFNTQLTGVSLTPTITWQPPMAGTANFYQIDVVQLTISTCVTCAHPTYTVATNVATFQTPQPTLTLPPNVLMPGSMYVLVVTAKNAIALNLDSAPLRTTYPFAYADELSQMFTTAGTAPAAAAQAQGTYGPLVRNRKNLSARRH